MRNRTGSNWVDGLTITFWILFLIVMVLLLLTLRDNRAPVVGSTVRIAKTSVEIGVPKTQPTGSYSGRGYKAPDPVSRIIMQNPLCWLGVPGATCEQGTRTFLGE